jgi:aspartyl-tRNA(Asn)/glutamyl-tRNA(Gln) amidotransferase subunit A
MSALNELSIEDAARKLAAREISSTELTDACLDRIDATDAEVGSFLEVTRDVAKTQAAQADQRLADGNDVTPLTGIPIGLKDLFVTSGIRTTCASRILENFVPRFDSTVTAKLQRAGAVLVGKVNMDEFAMGSSCENSALGATRNPWDSTRVAGGSSGGSATAVAARQCLGTIGTDTGGSIRLPASYCGVVGMKPTYGRVSRYGMIAFASSLDQAGPFATTARGAASILQAIAGHDPLDSTSIDAGVPNMVPADSIDLGGLKIGVVPELLSVGLDPGVESAMDGAVTSLTDMGAIKSEVALPTSEYALATYYIVTSAEASSNLGRYDGVRFGLRVGEEHSLREMYGRTRDAGFGPEVKRRIMLGSYALSAGYYDAYYLKAMKVRTLMRRDFEKAFEQVDALVLPTSPGTAFEIGSRIDDPLKMYLSDVMTIPANLAGLPTISIPCGFDSAGMPIGLQIITKPLAEAKLFEIAAAYQDGTDWHLRAPELKAA